MYNNVKMFDVFTNIYRLKVDFKEQHIYLEELMLTKILQRKSDQRIFTFFGFKDDENLMLTTKFSLNVLNNVYRYILERKF